MWARGYNFQATKPENSSASGFVIWLAALCFHRFPTNPEATCAKHAEKGKSAHQHATCTPQFHVYR